jgi:GAF domain-containing protein
MHPLPHRARPARRSRPSPAASQPGPLDGLDLPRVLREACERARWSYAEVWVPDPAGDGLVLHPAWHGNQASARYFRPPTEALAFAPGSCLPGRAARMRQLVLVADVTVDPSFSRPAAARKAGLRAGLAVPVIVGDEVVAVLAFFGTDAAEAGPERAAAAQELTGVLARRLEGPVGQAAPA